MSAAATIPPAEGPAAPPIFGPVRLATLINLRWLAVIGQAAAVGVVAFGLGFPLPLGWCIALIVLSALLNIMLAARFGTGFRLSNRSAALLLAYDSVQLGGLLWLTGGLENPFSLLLVAPVSVSATSLPQRTTVLLSILVVAIASLLAPFSLPLPWHRGEPPDFDSLYIAGIWLAILCGVSFIAAYNNRVAHEARQLADALAATELTLSRQQHLSALDGLAAAAAHELGTPLSTIALAAKEMKADIPPGPLADDLDLILEQSARCRSILARLRKLGAEGGDPFAAVPVGALLEEVAKPYENGAVAVVFPPPAGAGPEPVIVRHVGLLQGLNNLIENATQFARTTVTVTAGWDMAELVVVIADDGPGFPPELLSRLGEPYLTTRARERVGADPARPGGLGLGIFIARTLLERSGARLTFSNDLVDGSHARVQIVWPRAGIEARSVL